MMKKRKIKKCVPKKFRKEKKEVIFLSESSVKAKELLKGAVDLHVHTGPDVFPRLVTDIEAAKEAKEAGMKAILIKNHISTTADRAQIASEVVDFPVYGGTVLNLPVGGINIHAVEMSIRLGVKTIWMPTIFSENHLKDISHIPMFQKVLKPGTKGIYLLDEDGKLRKDVQEVLALIADHDVVLATGHVTIPEALTVVEEAKKLGVKKIIATHPLSPLVQYSLQDMKTILDKGATVIEHNILDTTEQCKHPIEVSDIANAIKALGAENCLMATDGGQVINPTPVKMMEGYIASMLDHGISEEDISKMVSENPSYLLEG